VRLETLAGSFHSSFLELTYLFTITYVITFVTGLPTIDGTGRAPLLGMKHFRQHAMRGFSLVEILIVTSITLTVSAIAIPKMMTTIASVELRSAIHSAAGVMQQARMRAIKDARVRKVRYSNGTGGGLVYIDLNDNGSPDAIEPQAQTGTTVVVTNAPTGSVTALGVTELGFTPVTTTVVAVSAIGQPCSAAATPGAAVTACAVGMVMYFNDSRVSSTQGWSAVAVSPAGRVTVWMWSWSVWKQV